MNICSKVKVISISYMPTVKTKDEYTLLFEKAVLSDLSVEGQIDNSIRYSLKEYFELFATVEFSKGYGKTSIELRRFDPNELMFVMNGIDAIERYRTTVYENNDELGIYCYKKYVDTLPDELKLLLEVCD